MSTARKQYDDDFKLTAVKRMKKESAATIVADLKIRESMLYHWRKRFAKEAGITLRAHKKTNVLKAQKKVLGDVNVTDAVIYLKHARREMTSDLRAGKIKQLSQSNLLSLLALGSLTGERS